MQSIKLLLLFVLPIFGFSQSLEPTIHLSRNEGLLQNTIWAIEEDYSSRVWLGSQEGLQIFDGNNLTTVPNIKETIFALYHVDSTMYCLTLGNLYKIDETTFKFQKVKLKTTDYYYYSFTNSKLSITTSDGLSTANFDLNLQLIDSIPNRKNRAFECNEQLGEFQLEGNQNGISYYRHPSDISLPPGTVIQYIKDSHQITSKFCTQVIKYDKNHIFISTHKGLIEVINQGDSLFTQHHLTNHRIERLMIDRNKNLWVGTADIGALLIHRNTIISSHTSIKNSKGEDLTCWKIFELDSNTYVSTSQGVRSLSEKTHNIQLTNLTKEFNCLTVKPTPNFLLIGTGENGIIMVKNNHVFTVYQNAIEALDNTIIQIIANETGYIAISKRSFIQLDKTGAFLFRKKYLFSKSNTYAMYLESIDAGYRVSTTNGVFILNNKLDIISKHTPKSAKLISMTTPFQGNIWASSFDSGIVNLTTGYVLSKDKTGINFLSIINLKDHSLWASSNTSIFEYSPPHIRPFTKENGFSIGEYNQLSAFKDTNDVLYYGGNGIVVKFNPTSLNVFPKFPTVILKQNNKTLNKSHIIQVSFDQAQINLFINPIIITDKNYFKVELIVNDSIYVIKKPQNVSIKIPFESSSITLKITDTVHETSQVTTYKTYRQLPFWKSTWFIVVTVIIGIGLILGIYSFIGFLRTKKLLKIEQANKKITEERLRISKELHDNIGARITHIISSLDIELYQRKDQLKSIETINSFARETMSQLRETIWAVSDKTIFFSEFMLRVQQYIDQVNELSLAQITLQQSHIPDFECNPIQTINYYRIIQESINNANKYAQAKNIDINLTSENKNIIITVSDNGNGFDTKNTPPGTGIKSMKTRATEAGGDFNISSSKNGTIVTIIIK